MGDGAFSAVLDPEGAEELAGLAPGVAGESIRSGGKLLTGAMLMALLRI
jgi:hypothetical protein